VSPAQEVSSLDADQTEAEASSSPDHDASVDQFINVLLNVDHDTQKLMIIKLVSNIDLRRSIEEVLLTIPIISQATFNKSAVNWEECTPPYAVDKRAFRNHTRGKNKGLPRNSDPNICTVGERLALLRAKKKVLKAFVGIGTLEQQRLILLRVLSDPSFRNISSSIGINMKETKLGQQILRCARKLIGHKQHSSNKNKGRCRTSLVKQSVVKALCLGLLPTPTKEINNNGILCSSKREISMREISKQLGFSVGNGIRTLLSVEKKQSDIAEGREEGWIMLNEDEQRTKYSNELLDALEYWIKNNDMVRHSPFKDNLVIKRDQDGSIVRDPTTRQPVRVQKMMLMCNPHIYSIIT
jgi:hypothetical protein